MFSPNRYHDVKSLQVFSPNRYRDVKSLQVKWRTVTLRYFMYTQCVQCVHLYSEHKYPASRGNCNQDVHCYSLGLVARILQLENRHSLQVNRWHMQPFYFKSVNLLLFLEGSPQGLRGQGWRPSLTRLSTPSHPWTSVFIIIIIIILMQQVWEQSIDGTPNKPC